MRSVDKSRKIGKIAASAAKNVLSLTGTILIEIMEKWEDEIFLYHHHWAGRGQSIRADRKEYEEVGSRYGRFARKQAIKRLRVAKLIRQRREGERVVLELTKSGKIRALEAAIKSARYPSADKTCLVSFDFPEVARDARNHFRLLLKRSGFKFVQGSVWSSPRDATVPLMVLIGLLRIRKWVKVFIVSESCGH